MDVHEDDLLDQPGPPAIERLRGTNQDIKIVDRIVVACNDGTYLTIKDRYPPDVVGEDVIVIKECIERPNVTSLRSWSQWVDVVKERGGPC